MPLHYRHILIILDRNRFVLPDDDYFSPIISNRLLFISSLIPNIKMHSNNGREGGRKRESRKRERLVSRCHLRFSSLSPRHCAKRFVFFNMRIAFSSSSPRFVFSDFLFVAARFFALIMMMMTMCVCVCVSFFLSRKNEYSLIVSSV